MQQMKGENNMNQYKYYKGSYDRRETIEFDLMKRGRYVTTCVVDAQCLIDGSQSFPCGNGDSYRTTPKERMEMLAFLQAERQKALEQ